MAIIVLTHSVCWDTKVLRTQGKRASGLHIQWLQSYFMDLKMHLFHRHYICYWNASYNWHITFSGTWNKCIWSRLWSSSFEILLPFVSQLVQSPTLPELAPSCREGGEQSLGFSHPCGHLCRVKMVPKWLPHCLPQPGHGQSPPEPSHWFSEKCVPCFRFERSFHSAFPLSFIQFCYS